MILVLWMLSVPALRAQWYGGIEGGVPFGMSSFSSFGADKTRAGYALGLFGGYRFTSVLSAECSAKWGKTNLAARDCCAEGGYWLGTDRMTYHAPVAGLDGADYARTEAPLADAFYHTESLKAVTLVTDPYTANTDVKDAAYGNERAVNLSDEGVTLFMTLQRPSAGGLLALGRRTGADTCHHRRLALCDGYL